MAGALPIILAAGAAVLLLGKKKKRAPAAEEPEFAPGAGMPDPEGLPTLTVHRATLEREVEEAIKETPARMKKDPKKLGEDAVKEQEEEEKKDPPKKTKCKTGTLSANRKKICWGDRSGAFTASVPQKKKMRRVPKYKTVRRVVAAVGLTGGLVASPLMRAPQTRFMLYCWLNRNKGLYRCTKRWRTGRKRCRKWKRY